MFYLAAKIERRPFMTDTLIHALVEMQETEALQQAKQLVDAGTDPMDILDACSKAMEQVGQRFEKGEYFLPHLMMAGEMLKQISDIIKPLIKEEKNAADRGRILMGTVKGDIHDIGKNIVTFLLETNGFKVWDIGIDQPPEKFVEGVREFQPQVVGMSGLLSLAFDSMKETVEAIEKNGLREKVKIMIGGGQVTEQVKDYTGADAFGPNAIAAVKLTKQWIGEK
jgi:methylmalonyl-CoA mutase cobalamin-binding domain/chain